MRQSTANWLERLLATGTLTASSASAAVRRELTPLLESGALTAHRSGAGLRYAVGDEAALRGLLRASFPTLGEPLDAPPRSTAVSRYRDAKRGGSEGIFAVHLRALGPALWHSGSEGPDPGAEHCLDVQALTRRFGVAGLALRSDDHWCAERPIALIENIEPFFHLERLYGRERFGTALFYGGWVAQQLLGWLGARSRAPEILIYPDYDPVGLRNALAVHRAARDVVTLVVPPNLETLLARYGKRELLTNNTALLPELLAADLPSLTRVLEIMQRHGQGLEQEILLRPELFADEHRDGPSSGPETPAGGGSL